MSESSYPLERLVEVVTYQGVGFEVVERPDVIWVGCVDYADNKEGESDIDATLKRYREELSDVPKHELISPDYSASLSLNYGTNDKPNGLMFAQETCSNQQDNRYDLLVVPGSLWIRTSENEDTDTALFGRKNHGLWEYFGMLESAAVENGYQRADLDVAIEYYNHSGTGSHYAYMPIVRV